MFTKPCNDNSGTISTISTGQHPTAAKVVLEAPVATAILVDYEITDVVCEGLVTLEDGTKTVYAHVKWSDSLVPRKDVVWTKEVPWGLPEESLALARADDPVATAVAERKFNCSFCPSRFTVNYSRRPHENRCSGPGGPKHVCRVGSDGCKPNRPGPVPYVPTEDLRKHNGRKAKSIA
uniref:Uncharacterized protein n=1 Tax=Tetranychus urticae TaxID=32264 RepID=T1L5A7_TETUR